MSSWQQKLDTLRRDKTPAVLVSVDSIVGSTPREAGAKMIVTAQHQYGTIGGGNLEFQACRIARNQLDAGAGDGLQRFPLGAGLGQCCGGLVNLMFERLTEVSDWSKAAIDEEVIELYLLGQDMSVRRWYAYLATCRLTFTGSIAVTISCPSSRPRE